VSLGIGGIIGAGIFVRTAAAIAERSGPSVTLAFIVAGIGCAFAASATRSSRHDPDRGSAYTYSYATMGEFVAWIIGWDLVLEYASAPRRSPSPGASTSTASWLRRHGHSLSMAPFASSSDGRRVTG
jgi:amino acid transporter